MPKEKPGAELFAEVGSDARLVVITDYFRTEIRLEWAQSKPLVATACLKIRLTDADELTWELEDGDKGETFISSMHRMTIRRRLNRFRKRFPVRDEGISFGMIQTDLKSGGRKPMPFEKRELRRGILFWELIEGQISGMAQEVRIRFMPVAQPAEAFSDLDVEFDPFLQDDFRLMQRATRRKEEREREAAARLERLKELRRRREERLHMDVKRQCPDKALVSDRSGQGHGQRALDRRAPIQPVGITIETQSLDFQETMFVEPDLSRYFITERAATWWVSNQSDDLLCIPFCKVQRLEYQIRAALRAIGPMRGRALLSDEVGLGKTIEAGFVLKEYLVRGMVKRFLILTVPSLVDQWEEELLEKFEIRVSTTNHAVFRSDPAAFWRTQMAIVASLHTLKQAPHLTVAREMNWDLLIIDEAHYLRNRSSQAWRAVNILPRQFLLLLTATPVQNSLEDLYNLVTLLKPGHLPSPKEFHERYVDKEHPGNVREPEELRRLLGQVMIRNTRSNVDITLPPRRAETILFEPTPTELEFWQRWEREFRASLEGLSPGQASLWGRLLLQAAGSSPAAWLEAVASFPDKPVAQGWREHFPMEPCWTKKCALLPPLTQAEGGVVVFTQFLKTQAALAEYLNTVGEKVWMINGQTPVVDRQPITEQFRSQGGALLLTHSGTEGRNLQFCHRLVNFDLPWNPMEIEQRIGRLHRIGQKSPVEIYNLVQQGTLQEHLLRVLQEKLNLFELVVGETGLILGDRFSSDEFAEEIFRRWKDSANNVAAALTALGDELAEARANYENIKEIDTKLFEEDYETV